MLETSAGAVFSPRDRASHPPSQKVKSGGQEKFTNIVILRSLDRWSGLLSISGGESLARRANRRILLAQVTPSKGVLRTLEFPLLKRDLRICGLGPLCRAILDSSAAPRSHTPLRPPRGGQSTPKDSRPGIPGSNLRNSYSNLDRPELEIASEPFDSQHCPCMSPTFSRLGFHACLAIVA